jgi:hypothetical protein
MGVIGADGVPEQEVKKWYEYGQLVSGRGLKCAVCGLRYDQPLATSAHSVLEIRHACVQLCRSLPLGACLIVCCPNRRGATAGCCDSACPKSYHYTCARIAAFRGDVKFALNSRTIACCKHAKR